MNPVQWFLLESYAPAFSNRLGIELQLFCVVPFFMIITVNFILQVTHLTFKWQLYKHSIYSGPSVYNSISLWIIQFMTKFCRKYQQSSCLFESVWVVCMGSARREQKIKVVQVSLGSYLTWKFAPESSVNDFFFCFFGCLTNKEFIMGP